MEIDPLKNKVDYEMKAEIREQRKTKPSNMFFRLMLILGVLMIIAMIGAFWSSNSEKEKHNMGIVTPQDSAIVNKSDTLKQ